MRRRNLWAMRLVAGVAFALTGLWGMGVGIIICGLIMSDGL